MVRTGEELLKAAVGKKVLWVGEDSDDGELLVLFDDFTAVSLNGEDVTPVEDGKAAVKDILEQRIKSAEGVLALRDQLKAFEEKTGGSAADKESPAPASGA